MKDKPIIIGLIVAFGLIMLTLFVCYDNANRKLELELKLAKEAAHNDSILVSEYQKSFQVFMDSDPKSAANFSKIMESINCK